MQEELLPEETQYLQQRGFEVVEGRPSGEEPLPYVTLREPQRWIEHSEITYHLTSHTRTGYTGVAHPSVTSTDQLVRLIEDSVSDFMNQDGKMFQTQPGKPIKVFVIDPAWKETAESLAAKYK